MTDLNPSPFKGGFLESQTGSVPHPLSNVGEGLIPGHRGCQSFDGSIEYLHNLAVLDALDLIVRPESAGQSDSTNST